MASRRAGGDVAGAAAGGRARARASWRLEKRLKQVERACTDVAIKKELLERILAERPTMPGKWSK